MVENLSYNFSGNYYFHVCSDGNKLDWLFKDDEDFISGVNRIALCSLDSKVEIYSYVLMANHIHILIYGTVPMCKEFVKKYKLLTGKWISNKYGDVFNSHNFVIQAVKITSYDYLFNVMAYIDRNILNTNYSFLASEYPWGSANYLFKDRTEIKDKALREITKRQKRLILNTHMILPDNWSLLPNGMLNPACFVSYEKVESLFQTPRKYIFHLSKKVEGEVDHELYSGSKTIISDKEMRLIVKDLSEEIFNQRNHRLLNFESRLKLARKLKYEYNSTPKQISRMLGIPVDVLSGYI